MQKYNMLATEVLNLPKKYCKDHAVDENKSNVCSIEDYNDIRKVLLDSIAENSLMGLWTRNIAMNSTHYFDDFGTYEFPR